MKVAVTRRARAGERQIVMHLMKSKNTMILVAGLLAIGVTWLGVVVSPLQPLLGAPALGFVWTYGHMLNMIPPLAGFGNIQGIIRAALLFNLLCWWVALCLLMRFFGTSRSAVSRTGA